MARGRAFARHLFSKKQRRKYTFLKTKLVFKFLISVFASIYIGTYLEQHGGLIVEQGLAALQAAIHGQVE